MQNTIDNGRKLATIAATTLSLFGELSTAKAQGTINATNTTAAVTHARDVIRPTGAAHKNEALYDKLAALNKQAPINPDGTPLFAAMLGQWTGNKVPGDLSHGFSILCSPKVWNQKTWVAVPFSYNEIIDLKYTPPVFCPPVGTLPAQMAAPFSIDLTIIYNGQQITFPIIEGSAPSKAPCESAIKPENAPISPILPR